MTVVWMITAIILAVLGMRLMAPNSAEHKHPLRQILGFGLWVMSLLSTGATMPLIQAVFTELGLLSLVGMSWVFLHPKQPRVK